MKRTPPLNPYIALSDIGLSGLLMAVCLCAAWANQVKQQTSDATKALNETIYGLKEQNDDLNKQIYGLNKEVTRLTKEQKETKDLEEDVATQQKSLEEALSGLAKTQSVPTSPAKSSRTLLVRLATSGLFEGARLSQKGEKSVRSVAHCLAPSLSNDLNRPCDRTKSHQVKSWPIEIQVRGHCRRDEDTADTWQLSTARSLDVLRVLKKEPGFPIPLVTVAGASWRRPAYASTLSTVGIWYHHMVGTTKSLNRTRIEANPNDPLYSALRYDTQFNSLTKDEQQSCVTRAREEGVKKRKQDDRIDILITYSGLQNEDTFVPAVNEQGHSFYPGPLNDTSNPDLYSLQPTPTP